jgi:hypothetical protein
MEAQNMPNHPALRSSRFGALSTDRATGKAFATLQSGAFLERANDEALRELVVARISDIGIATRHGLEEGHEIVRELVARIEADPMAAKALGGIAEVGVHSIEHELRRLVQGR